MKLPGLRQELSLAAKKKSSRSVYNQQTFGEFANLFILYWIFFSFKDTKEKANSNQERSI